MCSFDTNGALVPSHAFPRDSFFLINDVAIIGGTAYVTDSNCNQLLVDIKE